MLLDNDYLDSLDFSGFENEEILKVREAIDTGEDFCGYIPEKKIEFILKNYITLSKLGCLERNWISAYVHGNWPKNLTFEKMKTIFDCCDRDTLNQLYPLTEDHLPTLERGKYHCITLFRGCSSNTYIPGMSWTTNLSKALWYAAHSRAYNNDIPDNQECSVYTAIVTKEDVYCFLTVYDPDYIVVPKNYWKIDVPQEEFRLDRIRW